jgi:putative membrane protein
MGYGLRGFGYWHGLHWLQWAAPVAMLLFWAAVVTGIVFLIRYLVIQSRSPQHEDHALSILRARYAKGDISKEEFDQKKKDII